MVLVRCIVGDTWAMLLTQMLDTARTNWLYETSWTSYVFECNGG